MTEITIDIDKTLDKMGLSNAPFYNGLYPYLGLDFYMLTQEMSRDPQTVGTFVIQGKRYRVTLEELGE